MAATEPAAAELIAVRGGATDEEVAAIMAAWSVLAASPAAGDLGDDSSGLSTRWRFANRWWHTDSMRR